MTAAHELFEYEERTLQLSDRQARLLAATGRVSVLPNRQTGCWDVKAGGWVGSLVVGDVRLLVRPKIRLENLFLMLETGLRPEDWRDEAVAYAQDAELLPAVVSFLARATETTLARGLFRRYRERSERLLTLRGRLDLAATVARAGLPAPLDCRYDDFTADIIENRYLKAALRRALWVPQAPARDRRRLLGQLADLNEVADAPIEAADLDRVVFNRLNEHYRPALSLARLVLENLTLLDRLGGRTAASFMLDMNSLFERFVTERLRRGLKGRLVVKDQYSTHLGRGRTVPMKPDLVFERDGEIAYVGDVKYKLTGSGEARDSGDYYQMLAYTTALDLGEGVLIYCRTEDSPPGRPVTVQHSGQVLHTRALDLTGSSEWVARQLDELADWIADRAG